MKRRDTIKLLAASSLLLSKVKLSAEESKNKIYPSALKTGDKVAIISPGSAVSSPDDLAKAKEIMYALGLEFEFAPHTLSGSGYKTRTVSERVEDLHWAFKNGRFKAVFCLRGGYGSASLLKEIDFNLIESNPKVFCGYSDITALHQAIHKKTGLITFHSPVLLSSFRGSTFESFKNSIFTSIKSIEISNPKAGSPREAYPIYTFKEGKAEGELIGGNLSLISSLMGTPYEIETEGKLLFIEDVGESPYRLHRMLTQLDLAGKLENLSGVIIGKCDDCKSGASTWDQSEMEVYNEFFGNRNYPGFYGLLIGHTSIQFTICHGLKYVMDSKRGAIAALEDATL